MQNTEILSRNPLPTELYQTIYRLEELYGETWHQLPDDHPEIKRLQKVARRELRIRNKQRSQNKEQDSLLDRLHKGILPDGRSIFTLERNQQRGNPWSQDDDMYLVRNFHKQVDKDIALHLNRSLEAVRMRKRELGIAKKQRQMSEDDIQFVKENINRMTYAEMEEVLGFGQDSIRYHAKRLGIKKEVQLVRKHRTVQR